MEKNNAMLEHGMFVSWAIALAATIGSLYFSEVLGAIPCTYCWYQRILMYPLVIILGMAAVRKDFRQTIYVIPLVVLGMGMSLFHYLKQKTDWFQAAGSNTCSIVPCTKEYINWLGFVTIPLLAFIAFVMIFVIQFALWRQSR